MNKTQALKEARTCFKTTPWDENICRSFMASPFEEVRSLAIKQMKDQEEEKTRLNELLQYERALWDKGLKLVAGIDEVGRGPLAGPVVAGVVIFPPGEADLSLWGLNDSKKLSEKKRQALEPRIKEKALVWAIAWQNHRQIDTSNIVRATGIAMKKAVDKLPNKPDFLLVDGNPVKELIYNQQSILKGDSLSLSIAAASVLAKCFRDRLMEDLDSRFPQYHFGKNKGYGSSAHCLALGQCGPSALHRRSFLVKGLSK